MHFNTGKSMNVHSLHKVYYTVDYEYHHLGMNTMLWHAPPPTDPMAKKCHDQAEHCVVTYGQHSNESGIGN